MELHTSLRKVYPVAMQSICYRGITYMPTQKFVNRNIRKLTKLGKASLAVTLPIDLVAKLGWREKQKVVVIAKGKHLIIKDWKK